MRSLLLFSIVALAFLSCQEHPDTLFSRLSAGKTGIDFKNILQENDPEFSILGYPYFYNGGGVAIGDINNDELPDILFTGNMVTNALYLNQGNLEFKDITTSSTISDYSGWNSGAVMIDINNDGWLDLYICRSGMENPADRKNLLFINNHDLTFTESAARFGLDDAGYSTQSSFFDYDKDGDLDMILINQSDPKYARGYQDYMQTKNQKADSLYSNKLFRNDDGHFVNVSAQAGIRSTIYSFSLGLSTADIDQDGWPDIYIGNDFEEPDYLYMNNGDGTFTDRLSAVMDHTSLFSMGVDVADYNNDLLVDILTLDMLPEENYDQKMHIAGDNFSRNNYMFQNGVPFQYMKNSLQKNNGDGTFSEIAQLAGISNTNWSWSPLLADFDNDGLKDVFISNGYKRDNTNMEFMGYAMNESLRIQKGEKAVKVPEYISHMPGIRIPNYIFKNNGDNKFENKIKDWGFDHNTFSHGAAYADLDSDGDLDLVTNNTDDEAGVYRNNSEKLSKNNFLRIRLLGDAGNTKAIGSRVYVFAADQTFYMEQAPVRGYQSSTGYDLVIGLGKHRISDSIRIVWPTGKSQKITNVESNTLITLSIADASTYNHPTVPPAHLLTETRSPDFVHAQTNVNDFSRQFLLPYSLSYSGPCMTKGDVNGDGLNDIFIGGAKGQAGAIFLQQRDSGFTSAVSPAFELDKDSEDADARFFDADGDRDLDLYVVSGGYENENDSPLLQDRLYLNNGKGFFSRVPQFLPKNLSNKTCVRPVDFDSDGDLDLFVGGGVVCGNYPMANPSKIFFNDGHGNFTSKKPANAALGIVSDAAWIDLNGDGKKDLIVAGQWAPLKAFLTEGTLFTDVSKVWFPFSSTGLWNCIATDDFDNDGDQDLVIGNYGLNSQLAADEKHPLEVHVLDIDGNGSLDPVITHYIGKEPVPLVFRDDIIAQVPSLKKKFNDYSSYANVGISAILSPQQLQSSVTLKAETLMTLLLENTGSTFVKKPLPNEVQFSSVHAITTSDINSDGIKDLILGGNNIHNRIFLGRDDANHGLVLLGDGHLGFKYVPQNISGLSVRGEVRSIVMDDNRIFFGVNDAPVKSFRFNTK